jgi:hypothetical protein
MRKNEIMAYFRAVFNVVELQTHELQTKYNETSI